MDLTNDDRVMVRNTKRREKARKRRNCRRREERELKRVKGKKECVECECGGWVVTEERSVHCTCICSPIAAMEGLEKCSFLSTEQQLLGVGGSEVVDPFERVCLPVVKDEDLDEVREGQKGEKSVKIRLWLNEKKVPDHNESLNFSAELLSVLRHLSLYKMNEQGVIYRLFVTSEGTVWPLIFKEGENLTKVILSTHEQLGHGSKKAVFEVISKRYYDTGLRRKINETLKGCAVCLKYNIPKTIKHKQSTLLASQSRQVLQMDLLGPLPQSHGYKYIWAGCDAWDRSCYIRGFKGTTAKEMGELMAKFFSENGKWEFVKIDARCLSFKGVDKILMDKLGVGIIRSNHCSRHQGMVERLLQTILIKLLKLLDADADLSRWYLMLGRLEFVINSSPHSALHFRSPNELRYRVPPVLAVPPLARGDLGMVGGEFDRLVRVSKEIREAAFKGLVRNKSYYRVDESLIKGQIVWRKRQSFLRNMNKKLQLKILEAYEVEERLGTGLYRVRNVENDEVLVLPVDQLVRCGLNKGEVLKILNELKQ